MTGTKVTIRNTVTQVNTTVAINCTTKRRLAKALSAGPLARELVIKRFRSIKADTIDAMLKESPPIVRETKRGLTLTAAGKELAGAN